MIIRILLQTLLLSHFRVHGFTAGLRWTICWRCMESWSWSWQKVLFISLLTATGSEPINHCACAVSHDLYFVRALSINHIFKICDPYLCIHFATCMALRWTLTSVIHQNGVQSMLKVIKFTMHFCVTWPVGGVKTATYLGISDPNFPGSDDFVYYWDHI